MKNVIKHYFPLIISVLGALFAFQIFFHGVAELPSDLFTAIGRTFTDLKQKDNLSTIAQKEEAQPKVPLPSILYTGRTLTIGNAFYLQDLFTLSFSDGTIVSPNARTDAALYLNDIRNLAGESVLTSLSSFEIENLEELPSPVVYDTEQQLLHFHQSGIYQLSLRLFLEGEDGVLFTCSIPVEVN